MRKGTGKTIAFLSLTLMLSACGGGDGGGTASFTSWSSIQPSSTVVAQGQSLEDRGGTSVPLVSSSTATLSFDADKILSELVLRTPTTTVSVDVFQFGVEPGFVEAGSSTDLTTSAIFAIPPGYEYQTFGIWETGATPNNVFGAFSAGAPTVASNIPTTNGATFTGDLVGFYVDPLGNRSFAFGDVTVNANFGSRTLGFSTQNTVIKTDLGTLGTARSDLNLSGTLSYAAGTNTFTGSVTSPGSPLSNPLSGNSSGQFYGPSAQELGGVFFLSDPSDSVSLETYSGAYGAKVTP